MLSQVDSEGRQYQVLTEVTDHKRDDSTITKVGGFIKYIHWNLHQKRTTCVWRLLLEWKNVLIDWVLLKDLKYSKTVELDKYVVANEFSDEPASYCVLRK